MNYIVIIPARLASTRLSQKLLQPIDDKSVLEHTYRMAQKSQASRIIIAADHQRLLDAAASFGAPAVLTSDRHRSGTDRLAECVTRLALCDDDIIVNVQGDEPFMPPDFIDACASILSTSDAPVSTLATPISDYDDWQNPDAVKVVINRQGKALYFSRAAIPFSRDSQQKQNAVMAKKPPKGIDTQADLMIAREYMAKRR